MSVKQLEYERRKRSHVLVSGRQDVQEALKWFEDTPKTESAFYIRFQTLSPVKKQTPMTFWHLTDDHILFCHICTYWVVKVA
jgi:hypothetical protein